MAESMVGRVYGRFGYNIQTRPCFMAAIMTCTLWSVIEYEEKMLLMCDLADILAGYRLDTQSSKL